MTLSVQGQRPIARRGFRRVKYLIVNADDFGLAPGVNEGIIHAHTHGMVTSSSLIANGPAFDHAIQLAKSNPELSIGVHLVLHRLHEEHPCAAAHRVPHLLTAEGYLADRRILTKRLITGQIPIDEVRIEWEAQVEKCIEAGIKPTHIDGHGHVHIYYPLRYVVLYLARKYAIPVLRNPMEALHTGPYMPPSWFLRKMALTLGSMPSVRFFRRHGMLMPTWFLGMGCSGHLSEVYLQKQLHRLPWGIIELMSHPGYRGVSEEDWNAISETLFLLTIPGMRESIMEGLAEDLSECSKELGW